MPWSNLPWPGSVQLGSIPGSLPRCWPSLGCRSSIIWLKEALLSGTGISRHTERCMSRKTGFELFQPKIIIPVGILAFFPNNGLK